MKSLALLLYLLLGAFGQNIPYDANVFEIPNDDIYTWRSPNPYPLRERSLIVSTEAGYMIQVTVKAVDIDGAAGDFLLIKSGTSTDDTRTGRIFTHHLNTEREFLSLTHNVYLQFSVLGTNTDSRGGFAVDFQRFGDQATTPESTTPAITWPTPSDEDSIYITVIVSGRNPDYYRNSTFQEEVANMATEYCNTNNFVLTQLITWENVHLNLVVQCPFEWRDNEDCVRIRFSLPVFLYDNSGYELTSDHLKVMWETLSDKYLANIGLANYVLEDTSQVRLIWIVVICLVILLSGVIMYISRMIGLKRIEATKKSKTINVIPEEKRVSSDSLGPHPLQAVPNLFEQEYPLYEPDLAPKGYMASPGIRVVEAEEDRLDLQQFTFPDKEHNKSSEL